MRRLVDSAVRRPRAWILGFLLVTAGFAAALPRLELRTDGAALHPPGHEVVRRSEVDRRTFHDPEQVIVLVSARAGGPAVASPAGFAFLTDLDAALRRLPEVKTRGVRSLASLRELRITPDEIATAPFLADVPADPAGFADLLRRIRAQPLADGTLLSPGGEHAALYAPRDEDAGRAELIAAVTALLAARRDAPFDLALTGPQVVEARLGEMILADLGRLVPVMVVVITLLLAALLRTLGGVLIPLVEVVVVLVWTVGLMALAGVPLTLVTTLLPVILMATAITDEIHLLELVQRRLAAAPTAPGPGAADARPAAVTAALAELGRPLVATSVTTAVGFLAFTLTTLAPLRHFGLFCAFGILLAMALTFTLIPALLVTAPERWLRPRRSAPAGAPRLGPLEAAALRLGGRGLLLGGALVLLAGAGAAWLRVEDNWIANFDPRSEIVTAERRFNRAFWGSHRFDVVLTAPSGYFFTPAGVGLVSELARRAGAAPGVNGVMSLLVPVGEIARASGETRPPAELPELLLDDFLTLARMTEDPYELLGTLTADGSQTRVQLFLQSEDYRRDVALAAHLDRLLAELLAGQSEVRAHASGDLPVGIAMVRAIVGNQLRSLALTFAAVALLVAVLFRGTGRALTVLAPVVATTVTVFGAMGYAGVPLTIATSMFASLVLGVGVDFGCHFLAACERHRRSGLAPERAIAATLATTGRAIRANAVVLTVGFAVLAFSSLRPNHTLGLLLAAALATAYLMTLLLLPGLLRRPARSARTLAAAGLLALALAPLPAGAGAAAPAGAGGPDAGAATQLMREVEERFRSARRGVRLAIDTRRDAAEQNVGQPDRLEIWGVVDGERAPSRMLFVFSQPKLMRGTGLYLVDRLGDLDDALWYHMRSFNRFKRLPRSSLKLLVAGTCLTYEDAHGFLAADKYDFGPPPPGSAPPEPGEVVLAATPKDEALAADLGYRSLTVRVDRERMMVRRVDYHDAAGQRVKTLVAGDPVRFGELWLPRTARLDDFENRRFSAVDYGYWPLPAPPPAELFATEVGEVSLYDRFFAWLAAQGVTEAAAAAAAPPRD